MNTTYNHCGFAIFSICICWEGDPLFFFWEKFTWPFTNLYSSTHVLYWICWVAQEIPLEFLLQKWYNYLGDLTSIKWSEVAQSCLTLCDPVDTVSCQAPLSMGFSRQEHWNGLPFPSSGDLPDTGIEPGSPALQADALSSEPPGQLWTL